MEAADLLTLVILCLTRNPEKMPNMLWIVDKL